MNHLEIGQIRDFNFRPNENFEIKEILDLPEISMDWNWRTGMCPHCKTKIDNKVTHKFYRIEILIDKAVSESNIQAKNILALGFTEDGKILLLDKDKTKEALIKSKGYSQFAEVK